MATDWELLPKDDIRAQFAGLYLTINPLGTLVMNRVTYERLGAPAAFNVLFDRLNSRIALRPTALAMKHAYRACTQGRRGAKVVRANRLLKEYGIKIPDTLEFQDVEIDPDGMLIADLRTTRISPKAHSQRRKKAGDVRA